jgi:ABC-type nitrate/sulfonate/bicarbonate transport system permease component
MKILKPFEEITKRSRLIIGLGWLVALFTMWGLYGTSETHMFPTLPQVWTGFSELWNEGLMTHVFSSLWLCARAVFLAIIISLSFVYLSPIPVIKPVSNMISKLRYLPLTGIAFYITMIINDGREIQVWILVIFMTTFLITSLLSMLKDIPQEEFDHARALGMNRWEILWEVIVKGRMDYVIEIIRQNLAIVWLMLVTVESIMAAAGGLGFLIKNSDKFMNHGRIIALQIIILAIGLLLDFTIQRGRKILFRYSTF